MLNWFVNGVVSEDGRYLFIVFSHGTDPRNRLYVADLGDAREPRIGAPPVRSPRATTPPTHRSGTWARPST